MTTKIVKVLVPSTLAPAGGQIVPYVVYAKGRRHMAKQTVTRATSAALGRDNEGYFEATYNGHVWRIGRRVAAPEDPW
jgi:hypothetical protein